MPSPTEQTFPRPAKSVEVAPGVDVLPIDMRRIPAMTVSEAVRKKVTFEDGTKGHAYIFVERVHVAWMRVSEVEKLPLGLCSEVLMKLIRGGFVEGGQMAPNSTTVNIQSLLDHIEETREDPEFWSAHPERRKAYKEGIPCER
jgi:hypothetical protein